MYVSFGLYSFFFFHNKAKNKLEVIFGASTKFEEKVEK